MEVEELARFVEKQYQKAVGQSTEARTARSIGVAFPETLPPGINHYHLESGRNRETVGIAAAMTHSRYDPAVLLARLHDGILKAEYTYDRGLVRIPAFFNAAPLRVWQGDLEKGRFCAADIDGPGARGELRIREHTATWSNPGHQRATFNLVLPHSLKNLVTGFVDGVFGPLFGREQRSRDVVCDLDYDYGVPSLALLMLVLALRMIVFKYDFSPSS